MSRLALVTGAAGFIGSNIVAELVEAGWEVAACDRLRSAGSGKWRNLAKRPLADFVAPEAMWDWLAAHRRELGAVVRMGAVSATTEPDADLIVHTNFTLSRDLWRWCAEHETPLVYASSAATYGEGEGGFADADDLLSLQALRPLNAYGWSKALFDQWARREADRGRAPPQWAGLKFFNVYGPNEGHKGPMRSVVNQLHPKVAAGQEVQLFQSHRAGVEHGGQRRDFVYVRDCARVAAWLLEHREVSGIFNLGTGEARSFRDLAHAVFAAEGREPRIGYIPTPALIRDTYQYFTEAQMGRLRAAGYAAPFTSLEEGVGDYVRRFLGQADPYR